MRRSNSFIFGLMAASQFVGWFFTAIVVYFRFGGVAWNLAPLAWFMFWWLMFKATGGYFATRKNQTLSIVLSVLLAIVEQWYAIQLWMEITNHWHPIAQFVFAVPGVLLLAQSQIGFWVTQRHIWSLARARRLTRLTP